MGEPKVFLILIWLRDTKQTTSGSKESLICDFSRGEENAWWAFSLAPRSQIRQKNKLFTFSKTTFSKNNINAADGTRTHMVSRTILSRMRLPIPPQRHIEVH